MSTRKATSVFARSKDARPWTSRYVSRRALLCFRDPAGRQDDPVTIGDTRTWTVGRAQAEATRLKVLTDQGIDPRQVREEQRMKAVALKAASTRQNLTLDKAWSEYLVARKGKWSDRHYQDHLRLTSDGKQPQKKTATS